MSASRERILERLRTAQPSFDTVIPVRGHLAMVPRQGQTPNELRTQFVAQAEKLACVVHQPTTGIDAIQTILSLIGSDTLILSWTLEHIALPGLAEALVASGIRAVQEADASARVGITGVDAALAATGSLVLATGIGKPRAASLLPPVHIAIIHSGQFITDLEEWVGGQHKMGLEGFRSNASLVVISGPSRTADIAMQLILGMHGPGALHLVLTSD